MVTLYTVLHIHLLHWGLPQPSPVTTVLSRHRSQQSVETQQSWDQRGWRPCTECQSCNSVLLYPRELFLCAYILHCCHRLKVVYSYYLLWILAAVCLFAVVWCAREIFLFSVQFKKKTTTFGYLSLCKFPQAAQRESTDILIIGSLMRLLLSVGGNVGRNGGWYRSRRGMKRMEQRFLLVGTSGHLWLQTLCCWTAEKNV